MKKIRMLILLATLGMLCCVLVHFASAEAAYRIEVDKSTQRVTIYSTADGSVVYRFKCSTGSNPSSTPVDDFTLKDWGINSDRTAMYLPSEGQYFRWATRIYSAILFHTYLYDEKTEEGLVLDSVYDLGKPVSHGCIRLSVEAARWIAQNCLPGTRVDIIAGDGTGETQLIGLPDEVTRITLSQTGTVTAQPKETIEVTAVTEPEGKPGVWVSSDKTVATVSQDGVVTCKKDGTADIVFVTENGRYESFTVEVEDLTILRSVSIDEGTALTLQTGETLQLHASWIHKEVETTLTWTSSNIAAATVSKEGLVTALADGKTTVTVKTHNSKTATITIDVVDPLIPHSVVLDEHEIIVNLNETVTPSYTVYPITANQGVKWTMATSGIIKLSNGAITGIKEGSVEIAVHTLGVNGKGENLIDKAIVKVVDPTKPASVEIQEGDTIRIPLGRSIQLHAVVQPETAVTGLKWSTSASYYVSVDAEGVITGKALGYSNVQVQTTNNSRTDTIKVIVYDPTKATEILPDCGDTLLLHLGDTAELTYQLVPETATGGCTLTSSDANVLSVSGMTVEAIKAGTATLTLKAASGITKKVAVTVHTVNTLTAKEPTCETDGYSEGVFCVTCAKAVSGCRELPALGHCFAVEQCVPAASNDGVLGAVVCARCGQILQESSVLPADEAFVLPPIQRLTQEVLSGTAPVQIIVPETVSCVESKAFADCSSLKLVILPDGIQYIAQDAFQGSQPVIACSEKNHLAQDYAARHGLYAWIWP